MLEAAVMTPDCLAPTPALAAQWQHLQPANGAVLLQRIPQSTEWSSLKWDIPFEASSPLLSRQLDTSFPAMDFQADLRRFPKRQ